MKSFLLCIISACAIVVLICLNCQAQANTPAPSAAPSTQPEQKKTDPPATDDSKPTTKGKSKLEKETGTVNDRILDVMPNYGTVEDAHTLPPISSGKKYRLATAQVFDYFAFPFNGVLAALDQASNSPKSWKQGWGAYGKRYGASFADNSIGTYMTTAIFPSMLHEDPRYFQSGQGSFSHRAYYSISRLVVAHTDSGHSRFNYSEIFGNALAAGISNAYHAPEDRTWGRNLTTYAMLDTWDGAANLLKEFWPDIHRKMQHKHKVNDISKP
ncbi:MAG TPA: hypothetical protein VLK33_10230 [Terriglobales bacterium]|nr:hypothetical protein [Terriglobales bacterium]